MFHLYGLPELLHKNRYSWFCKKEIFDQLMRIIAVILPMGLQKGAILCKVLNHVRIFTSDS